MLIPGRTHRERRAKYLLGLEAEVAHLRTRDAQNIVELRKLNVINTRLIALLTENNILIPRELEIVDDALITTGIELLDATGGSHNLRATSSTGSSVSQVPSPAETVDLSDPQVAINFVLALEKPCLDHFHLAHGEDGETGHIFMLQASMLETGPSKVSSHLGQSLPTDSRWDVPRQQLDQQLERLVSTARQLNLNGELTPVMCWFKLRERLHGNTVSSDKLDRIRNELFPHVACFG